MWCNCSIVHGSKNVDETFCRPENKRKLRQSDNLEKYVPKTTYMALQFFTQDNFTTGTCHVTISLTAYNFQLNCTDVYI